VNFIASIANTDCGYVFALNLDLSQDLLIVREKGHISRNPLDCEACEAAKIDRKAGVMRTICNRDIAGFQLIM